MRETKKPTLQGALKRSLTRPDEERVADQRLLIRRQAAEIARLEQAVIDRDKTIAAQVAVLAERENRLRQADVVVVRMMEISNNLLASVKR